MSSTINTTSLRMPPKPVIEDLSWYPPEQTLPIVRGVTTDRLMLYANADSHDWQQYVPDITNEDGGPLLNYWDGQPPADYKLTLRSYWMLVPETFTQVGPGGDFGKEYVRTVGIEVTDAQTISAEMGVEVEGLSAKISASFSHSVTTSSQKQESTLYRVGSPKDGFTRVWMLWQLVDELVALDANGNVVANPTRRGDVNWSEHNSSGAFLSYRNLQQRFPSTITIPIQKDFPD